MTEHSDIRALLWDIDGLFVDTESLHFRAWKMLAEHVGTTLTLEEYVPMIGRGSEKNLEDLRARKGLNGSTAELQRLRRAYYESLRDEGIVRIEEHIDLARAFKAAFPNLAFAAVSSARRADVEKNIKTAGLEDLFELVVACDDEPSLQRKPSPDLYERACAKLNLHPRHCVAFEDSANGVRAAARAHVRVVALPGHLTAGQDFTEAALVLLPGEQKSTTEIAAKLGFV